MAEDSQQIIGGLTRSAWGLTALTIALERGLFDKPGTVADLAAASGCSEIVCGAVFDVLAALGLAHRDGDVWTAAPGLAEPHARSMLLSDLRATRGLHEAVAARARDPQAALEGWPAEIPEIVAGQGESSRAATERIIQQFLPHIPGLNERLARPGAAVLDVGAGAAGLGVAFCRAYPEVRVVGLEPSPVAGEVARRIIEAEGLSSRLEIRPIFGQDLDDVDAYDLAYVAQMFIPEPAVPAVYKAALRALRPGGVLITAAVSQRGDDVGAATSRLRGAIWSGGVRFAEDVVAQLVAAGFAEARAMPQRGGLTPVLARK